MHRHLEPRLRCLHSSIRLRCKHIHYGYLQCNIQPRLHSLHVIVPSWLLPDWHVHKHNQPCMHCLHSLHSQPIPSLGLPRIWTHCQHCLRSMHHHVQLNPVSVWNMHFAVESSMR